MIDASTQKVIGDVGDITRRLTDARQHIAFARRSATAMDPALRGTVLRALDRLERQVLACEQSAVGVRGILLGT